MSKASRSAFDGDFKHLVAVMRAAAKVIDARPDDQPFTEDELATFDDIRMAASQLAANAETAIVEQEERKTE